MAENQNGDLVNLDDETQMHDSGSGASGNDAIINAAELFNQQLEQMTQWKTQLSSQMDAMRADGVKLLERQKTLALEKKRLTDERADLTTQRKQFEQMQGEVEAEAKRLQHRAGELENAQQRLLELQQQREQAERELAARQKSLTEQEARHLAEDVRLRDGMEQLEAQRRHLLELQRQAVQERAKLDGEGRALAERTQQLEQHSQSVHGREQEVAAGRQQISQAQDELKARHDDLARREQALAEKLRLTGEELQARSAALQAAEQALEGERQAFAKQKQELRARLEAFERDQAEQLDALARQTKRITERRLEVEAAESDLAATLQARITQATQALAEELKQSRGGHDQRVTQLEAQLAQAGEAARALQVREAQFQTDLTAAGNQLETLKAELRGATSALESMSQERSALGDKLAEQIRAGKEEAAQWQQKLEDVRAQSTGGNQALEASQNQFEILRKDFKKLKAKAVELQQAKDELEFQLEVRKEDTAKQLEAQRHGLTQQIAARDEEIADWRQKFDAAQASMQDLQATQPAQGQAPSPEQAQHMQALAQQVQTLQQQRDDLAGRLAGVQDTLRRQEEESLLAQGALEGRLLELTQLNSQMEAEKLGWQGRSQPVIRIHGQNAEGQDAAHAHRARLLRQAKALRNFRLQIRDTQAGLENSRAEIAQQREQLRARKENLEQVKRLLEKQEMVMARKLADHNAIKTVAVVGIFVIMVLGGAFLGVYRFVHPVYRSEAVVQLDAPQELQGAELETWLNHQMEFMRTTELTYAAWKVLRSGDDKYVMQDVREEWIGTLSSHLTMSVDSASKTLTIHYTGPDAAGVSQVANALAAAYYTPGLRETSTEATKSLGLGAKVVAQAAPPAFPMEDNRMMVSLAIVAGTLFLSLILVMIFRHFISRQLKEIDQMADAQELEEMHGDLPEGATPQT